MRFSKIKWHWLVLVLFLSSCKSGEADQPEPAQITIQASDTYSKSAGTMVQLNATVLDTDGNAIVGATILWVSADQTVATISTEGRMTLVAEGSVTVTASSGNLEASKEIEIRIEEDVELFELADLSDELGGSGQNSLQFLDETTFSAELIELSAGVSNLNLTQSKDQVIYLAEGSINVTVNGQDLNIATGSALFVAAGTSLRLTNVVDALKIIRTILNKDFAVSAAPFRLFTQAQMESNRSASQNAWNPFLNERSVIFGLYMLPQSRGGDGRLVHAFDEINIIVSGSSTFQTDKGTVSVKPGSIVFVREGNGHWFRSLNDDIDILILWNK